MKDNEEKSSKFIVLNALNDIITSDVSFKDRNLTKDEYVRTMTENREELVRLWCVCEYRHLYNKSHPDYLDNLFDLEDMIRSLKCCQTKNKKILLKGILNRDCAVHIAPALKDVAGKESETADRIENVSKQFFKKLGMLTDVISEKRTSVDEYLMKMFR